jgi:autotransporter-associated beta strand protein
VLLLGTALTGALSGSHANAGDVFVTNADAGTTFNGATTNINGGDASTIVHIIQDIGGFSSGAVTPANNATISFHGEASSTDSAATTRTITGTGTVINVAAAASSTVNVNLLNLTITTPSGSYGLVLQGQGSGATFNLTSNASFSSAISLDNATINIGNAADLGSTTNQVAVSNNVTLAVAQTTTIQQSFTGSSVLAFLVAANQTVTVASDITGTLGVTLGSSSSPSTGTLVLSGTNTYTGDTDVETGTLQITGSTTSNTTVAAAGTLSLSGTIQGNVTNAGHFDNSGTVDGSVTNSGTADNSSAGTINGTVTNTGTFSNSGIVSGVVTTNTGGTTTNTGRFDNDVFVAHGATLNQAGGSVAGVITNNGTVDFTGGTINNASIVNNGRFDFDRTDTITYAGVISGSGTVQHDGTGTTTLSGHNTYTGDTTVNAGTLNVTGSTTSNTTVATTGTLNVSGTIHGNITNNGAFDNSGAIGGSVTNSGVFGNSGVVSGVVTTNTGGTTTNTGRFDNDVFIANGATLTQTAGSIAGALTNNGTVDFKGGTINTNGMVNNGRFDFDRSDDITYDGVISGTGSVQQSGAGKTTLSGINTYTGATIVDGGTLSVSGDISSSALTTVNAGAVLRGNGTVGNLQVNGGTLAPGNIGLLTVRGNLSFTTASAYMIEVSPTSADRINVTGSASPGGANVSARFAPGTTIAKRYVIVNAAGGVNGAFNSVVNTDLPVGFQSSLSYDANNAYLDVNLAFVVQPSVHLDANQQKLANALVAAFRSNGSINRQFGGLTPAAMTQLSGETSTGSQQLTFNAMTQFAGSMLDHGTGGGDASVYSSSAYAPSAYASESKVRTAKERAAFDMISEEPSSQASDRRWSVWATGFGGSQANNGNVTQGSSSSISRIYGSVVGADYRMTPETVMGFAMAGGATNFSVANGGTGRSNLFQAGAFITHTVGASYISGAFAYGWQDVTTDRTVTVTGIDRLHAHYDANSYSGRIESGHRIATPWIGITPYAAAQVTAFDLPAYAEQVLSGSDIFALSYGAKDATATRGELGIRTDRTIALWDAALTLRGRAAWAHDFNNNHSITATFQSLPGSSFVVDGAESAQNSALTTLSAEINWLNGWSASATFEGEFSSVTTAYAGKGGVRYAW